LTLVRDRRGASLSGGHLTSVEGADSVGFTSSSARFVHKEQDSTPGVGSYDLPSSLPHSRTSNSKKSIVHSAAFGSSGRRFFNPAQEEQSLTENSVNTLVNAQTSQLSELTFAVDQQFESSMLAHRDWVEDSNTDMTPKGIDIY